MAGASGYVSGNNTIHNFNIGQVNLYDYNTIMTNNERRLLWIEMSIREIWTQCNFAEISYANIDKKSANRIDMTFSSIHSFLSHCTMVSKLLNGKDIRHDKELLIIKNIGQILNINDNSLIHKRKFRNHLEHYDERLESWIG
ncbi:MAG: hypothetical protein Q8T08_20280, partial [Ignavibacteria bacterium]|nr:hypothetical protein [Ignavibacteria bacterium]